MNETNRALLLVGSPRGSKSTSKALGTYLLDKLRSGGFETADLHIQTSMRSEESQARLLELVGAGDLLVLAFPLYIDSLPATVIEALELLAKQRKSIAPSKTQRLAVIVNNGFPEATQNSTALAICKRFAVETGIEWAGGLGLGGGGPIEGKPLEDAGFVARNVRKSLDMAARDLLEGKAVSEEATKLMAKPLIPKWLYLIAANYGWKKQAKACGTQDKLYDQKSST